MAAGTPAKKTTAPRKRTAKAAARPAAQPAEQPAAPEPAAPMAVEEPINRWLHGLNRPLRIEVFDRWWEFQQPTGGRAEAWDTLVKSPGGVAAALASMAFDRAPHGPGGIPGSALAQQFMELAFQHVPPAAAAEFWRRMERAIFDLGGASAS